MFSLGAFSAYQGHLSGPSVSVNLSYLIFPLVPVSVFFRRASLGHSLSDAKIRPGGQSEPLFLPDGDGSLDWLV